MNKFCMLLAATLVMAPMAGQTAELTCPVSPLDLDSLISQQQFQQAYELADTGLNLCEGEANFDFPYGLAALEAGFPNEAVYALERVAAMEGNSIMRERARLELARAYFVTNNLAAAETLFNSVLAASPPENVRQNILAFLQLIESRRDSQQPSFSWAITSAIGSDDNINSATSNSLIDTPLIGLIELNPDGQETDDQYLSTRADMSYSLPLDRNRSLTAAVNLTRLDNFSTDQFDIDSLRAEVAYGWGNRSHRIRHGFSANKINLDRNGFQDSFGVFTSWQYAGSNGWYPSATGSYSRIRYDNGSGSNMNHLRDVNQLLISTGLTKIHGTFTHSLNFYHAYEKPEYPDGGEHNGRRFSGLAYSLQYRWRPQHTPYLRTTAQKVRHDSEHPVFFDSIRADEMRSIAAGWLWQVRENFSLTAETSITDNSSNIELFDYSRFKYQAGFRYQF